MNARTLCLAILNFREATGYEIRKLVTEGNFSYFVDASYGAIYPALARLTEEGLIEGRDEWEPGKPARKVYSITNAGRRALIAELGEMPQPDSFKSPFLLIAMFAEHVDPAHLEAVVDARIAELTAKRDSLREALECCEHPGSRWILDYGIAVHSHSLDHVVANRDSLIAIAGTAATAEAAE